MTMVQIEKLITAATDFLEAATISLKLQTQPTIVAKEVVAVVAEEEPKPKKEKKKVEEKKVEEPVAEEPKVEESKSEVTLGQVQAALNKVVKTISKEKAIEIRNTFAPSMAQLTPDQYAGVVYACEQVLEDELPML